MYIWCVCITVQMRGTLARVGEKLSDITKQVADLNDDVEQLNTTLSQLAGEYCCVVKNPLSLTVSAT